MTARRLPLQSRIHPLPLRPPPLLHHLQRRQAGLLRVARVMHGGPDHALPSHVHGLPLQDRGRPLAEVSAGVPVPVPALHETRDASECLIFKRVFYAVLVLHRMDLAHPACAS